MDELFELCKEVYEKTGWKDGLEYGYRIWHVKRNNGRVDERTTINRTKKLQDYPLYTSDYLLDKLGSGAGIIKDSNGYTARRPSSLGVPENKDPLNGRVGWQSDTAVKALLTMIIDLERVGML